MKIWAEVFDANDNKLAPGPVWLESASVRTVLDQIGTFSLSVPLTYDRAREWFEVENRVVVYRERSGDTPHEMFSGVIDSVAKRHSAEGWSLDVSGSTLMVELTYKSTLLNRRFSNVPTNTAMTALLQLVPGWTAALGSSVYQTDARFDGASVFKAITSIASKTPYHIRQGKGRVLEFGAFGTDAGLVLMNANQPGVKNEKIAFIESLNVLEESTKVINWVIPIGGGEGEAATTLQLSNRSFVQSLPSADGRPLYGVIDSESIAEYGQKEAVWLYKDIAPISNSNAGKIAAANQLADAAYADLQKSKQSQVTYSITARKVEVDVKVGDVLRVFYTGPIRREDGNLLPGDRIDDHFFITRIVETASAEGSTFNFEVSNVQRPRKDAAGQIATLLDEATVRNFKPQPAPFWSENTYTDFIQMGGRWARFKIEVDDSVLSITRVRIRIKTKPLFRLSGSWIDSQVTTSANAVSPHTHIAVGSIPRSYFSVVDGTNYPAGISLWINGVNVSAQFGGPWNAAPINAPIDKICDITDILEADGMYREHQIEIRCAPKTGDMQVITNPEAPVQPEAIIGETSNGIVECNIRIQGVAQAIV